MATVRTIGRVDGVTELRASLKSAGLTDSSAPNTVLVAETADSRVADAVARERDPGSRTLVVLRAAGRDRQLVWHLLDLGAADVLSWSDGTTADQIVDRLRRWCRIDEAVASPAVAHRLVGRSPALRGALEDLIELAMFGTGPILLVGVRQHRSLTPPVGGCLRWQPHQVMRITHARQGPVTAVL